MRSPAAVGAGAGAGGGRRGGRLRRASVRCRWRGRRRRAWLWRWHGRGCRRRRIRRRGDGGAVPRAAAPARGPAWRGRRPTGGGAAGAGGAGRRRREASGSRPDARSRTAGLPRGAGSGELGQLDEERFARRALGDAIGSPSHRISPSAATCTSTERTSPRSGAHGGPEEAAAARSSRSSLVFMRLDYNCRRNSPGRLRARPLYRSRSTAWAIRRTLGHEGGEALGLERLRAVGQRLLRLAGAPR